MRVRVTLRPRRQITLSAEACAALGVKPGDELSIELQDDKLVIEAQRSRALDALAALQRAMAESGVTEEELLEGGRQVREELFREKYGYLLERRNRKASRRRKSA